MSGLKSVVVLSLATAAFGATAFAIADAADKPGAIHWQKDIYEAHDQAVKSGRPMLVVFGAEWCTFCKKFEAGTLSNATMAGYVNENFVPVHVDFDEDRRVADILEVKQIPCTVILSPEADLLGRVIGHQVPRDYWERLEDARELQAEISQVGHEVR